MHDEDEGDELKPWEVLEREVCHRNLLFTIRRDRCRSPRTRRDRDFFVMETADWVNVIALTPGEEVVLVEQHRFGSGAPSLEIPGGMVDPEDDGPAAAARRELWEETGYEAGRWIELGMVLPNPAIQSNRCTTFLALDATRVGAPHPDPWEDIRVRSARLEEIPELMRQGKIHHSLVVAAFHWLELYRRRQG